MLVRAVDTVIFDLGGVLSRSGRPSDIARRYPGHDPEHVLRVLMGDYGTDTDHPWHRLERGEITLDEHRALTATLLTEAGIDPAPPPASSTSTGGTGGRRFSFEPNGPVVDLVHDLRAHGVRLGVLTNNVREFRPFWRDMLDFDTLFDDVVDSHEVGMRKPNPAVYQLAVARLGADPVRTAFLDDVASNVAAANAAGLVGVMVDPDPTDAVTTVRTLTGLGPRPV